LKNFSKSVVITQPMFFPWVGMFEQFLLADEIIFYDDVQFSKGSFTNRVQIKTQYGMKWLTVPLENLTLGQRINEVKILNISPFKEKHLSFLENIYRNHPYKYDALEMVDSVYSIQYEKISELSKRTILEILAYFNIKKSFHNSSELDIGGVSSDRVLEIVKYFSGDTYITGHGAKNYLKHSLFEKYNIEVKYMKYRMNQYTQLHGDFTPYVSILDLVANEGKKGIEYMNSETVNWKEFVDE